jgi:WD40 repeat protein
VTEAGLRTERLEAGAPASPYKGLSSFAEADASFFFGREEETSIIAANLVASRLTLLYGASGVGKSSLLRAGVARRLREQTAENLEASGTPGFVLVVFPEDEKSGAHRRESWRDDPLTAIAAGIERAVAGLGIEVEPVDRSLRFAELLEAWSERLDSDVLLVLDQFEEYFLYHGDEEGERTLYEELPRALNRGALQANVLISIREDAYAKLDRFKGRIPFLYDNYLRVDHLDRDAARAAIEGPIEQWNRLVETAADHMEIEPELVDGVLDAVQTGSVVLGQSGRGTVEQSTSGQTRIETPFLQLVLERLWDEELGAGSHLLRLRTLEHLGGAERIVRTHLDKAMDELSAEDEDVAARVFRQLVTPSGTKIAHLPSDLAALENVESAQLGRVLETLAAARILRPVSPPPGVAEPRFEIFHDVLAPAVLDWRARYVRTQEHAELEERARQAQQREHQERRRARIFRSLALGALAALVLALAALGYAWDQKRAADGQRRLAESRALAAVVPGLLDARLDDGLLRALEARDRGDTLEARSALLTAVQRTSGLIRFVRFAQPVQALAAGSGGTIAVALEDGTLVLLDQSGRHVGGVTTARMTGASLAFDPLRPLLAIGLGRTVVLHVLRQTAPGRLDVVERRRLGVDQALIRSVAFSPDGRWLAAGGEGGVTLWRLDGSGHPSKVALGGSGATVSAVAFGGGALPLLAAANARGLRVWDLRQVRRGPRLIRSSPAGALAIDPDGGAWGVTDGGLVWLGAPAPPTRLLRGSGGRPTALAVSHDGTLLASGDAAGSVTLWDVRHRRVLGLPLRGHGGKIVSVAFLRDGAVLAAASADGTVALWDAHVRARLGSDLDLGGGPLADAAPGRDGVVAIVTQAGALSVRNLDSGVLWRVAPRGVEQVAASPDGRWLALATESGVAAAPLTTRTPLRRLRPQLLAQDVAIGRQGLLAAVGIDPLGQLKGNAAAAVQRWGAAGRSLPTLVPPGSLKRSVARSVAISADGRVTAAGYWNGAVVLWPPSASLTPPGVVLGTHRRRVTALAFDSEASLLASGDRGGTLELWRVGTRGPPTRLEAHAGEVLSLAFSPDGRMLASGSDDGAVRLWDPQEGRPLGDPLRLSGPVSAVAFSPDGRSLVAVHGRLTVWDASLWQPGKDVLERVRRRFCAVISSGAASSSRARCRRRA